MTNSKSAKTISINGKRISYLDCGQGEPIILLHGWTACKESFLLLMENLPGYRCLALDLPGYGDSEELDQSHSLANYVTVVESFHDRLGLAKVHLLGTSLGGSLTLLYSLKHPEKVRTLTVQASPYHWGQLSHFPTLPPICFQRWFKPVMVFLASITPLRRHYFKAIFAGHAFWEKIPEVKKNTTPSQWPQVKRLIKVIIDRFENHTSQRALAESGLSVLGIDLTQKLGSIQAPALVLWGRDDQVLDTNGGKKLVQLIPNASYVEIAKTGHFMVVEKPQAMAEEMRKFLNQNLS